MNLLGHKFCRTFFAMSWGWLVFCLSFPILAALYCWIEGESLRSVVGVWLAYALYSIPVVLAAWLVILFPVDCLLPSNSWLRRPQWAALTGVLVGPLPFVVLSIYHLGWDFEGWWRELSRLAKEAYVWLYLGGAAITGMAAALHLAKKHPPKTATIPTPPKR